MLNYDEVTTLLTIYELRNFSKTAQKLYVGQPALSKKVREIEKSLGYKIFFRGRGQNTIEISEQGVELLPILIQIKQLNEDAKEIKFSDRQVQVTIASSDGPYISLLDKAVEKLIKTNGKVIYRLKNLSYPECVDAVANGTVDLAFVGSPFYRKYVNILPLYDEHMVYICMAGMKQDTEIDPSKLNLSTGIYSPYSTEYSLWFRTTFNNRRPIIQCDLNSQVKRYIHSLGFWSIVPFSVAKYIEQEMEISILPIKNGPPIRIIYYAAKMTSLKPEALEFINCVRATLEEGNQYKIYE